MQLLTRAQMRDEIRRMIGMTPPVDAQPGTGLPVPGAVAGDVPPGLPTPTNEVINACISRVIAKLNMILGFHVTTLPPVTVPAMAANLYGPQWIELSTLTTPEALVSTILSVYFLAPTVAVPYRLRATSLEDKDRNDYDYERVPPSSPRQYVERGYRLGLTPGSVTGGTLLITCGTGMVEPEDDADTIPQMPSDWLSYFLHGVVVSIGEATPEDAEWQARIAVHDKEFSVGVGMMLRNLVQRNMQEHPNIVIDSQRRGYGTQRLRT